MAEAWDRLDDENNLRRDALAECLKTLRERQRRMLTGFYQDGQPIHEIAEKLGLGSDSVKTMLCRLRVLLRRCVEDRLAIRPSP